MTNIKTLGRAIARRGNRFQYTYCSAWGYSKPDSWGQVLRSNIDLLALQNGRRPRARGETK